MKKGLWLLLLICCLPLAHAAQQTSEDEYVSKDKKEDTEKKETKPFKDRLVFGGNLGGAFGTYSYFQVNPMVGYKLTDWWVSGIGFNYIYSGSRGYSQNIYGPSVWSRAYVFESIVLHTELEYLTMNFQSPRGDSYTNNAPVWLVGAGYQSTGQVRFGFLVLFDLLQDPRSPYSNPIFRVGGLIGF
jgi:hypothetical protein